MMLWWWLFAIPVAMASPFVWIEIMEVRDDRASRPASA
jgi:hypothetical protein